MNETEKIDHGKLLIQFRDQRDVRAFDSLLELYQKPLYNFLLRILQKKEDAEDALQEIWLKVVRRRDAYKEQGRFSSWLFCIAHNHCLDLFRKRNHRVDSEEIVATDDGLSLLDAIPDFGHDPFENALENELIDRLERAVADLPVLIREVYLLRTMQSVPFKEIAKIQEAPLGTVLSRMNQALKRLQPNIEQYMYAERKENQVTA